MKTTILTSTLLTLIALQSIAADKPANKETDPFDVTTLQKRIEETGVPTPQLVQQLEVKATALAKDAKWQEAAEAYAAFARSANWLANLIEAGLQPFYNASSDERNRYNIPDSDIKFEKLGNDYKKKRNEAMVIQAECLIRMGDTKRAVPILIRSLELINIMDTELWTRARKDLYSIIQVPLTE